MNASIEIEHQFCTVIISHPYTAQGKDGAAELRARSVFVHWDPWCTNRGAAGLSCSWNGCIAGCVPEVGVVTENRRALTLAAMVIFLADLREWSLPPVPPPPNTAYDDTEPF